MQLRWYQRAAVDAVWNHLCTRDDNPCVEVPTGGGKSAIIATLAHEAVTNFNGRVCVLAHVKELLEQNAEALRKICPTLDIGVYSAGLGLRDRRNSVIVGGIQSVYNKADKVGPFQMVLVDEAHLIQPSGEGRYSEFLDDLKTMFPRTRVVGLTATPYRLSSGLICSPTNILNHVCYKVGVKSLIAEGYLCKMVSKKGLNLDFSELHIARGEFVASEADALMNGVVNEAVGEILKYTTDRKSCLLFCQGKEHARAVQQRLIQQGFECGYVDGESLDRKETLTDFKSGRLKYLVNINVLTTGFDAPNVDCVALLRPTASPGLYYQMVGRGFRIAPGKASCLVLDFGGNVERHGPVDAIEVRTKAKAGGGVSEPLIKTCPKCQAQIAPGYGICPECQHIFPPREQNTHESKASNASVISEPEEFEVKSISYSVHEKKNAEPGTPCTLRVDYWVGLGQQISEWVCVEHEGFARTKAEKWWKQRSKDPCPYTASEAVELAKEGLIASVVKITANNEGNFWRILSAEIGELPESREELLAIDEDEIPF